MMGSLISDGRNEKRISGNVDSIQTDSCPIANVIDLISDHEDYLKRENSIKQTFHSPLLDEKICFDDGANEKKKTDEKTIEKLISKEKIKFTTKLKQKKTGFLLNENIATSKQQLNFNFENPLGSVGKSIKSDERVVSNFNHSSSDKSNEKLSNSIKSCHSQTNLFSIQNNSSSSTCEEILSETPTKCASKNIHFNLSGTFVNRDIVDEGIFVASQSKNQTPKKSFKIPTQLHLISNNKVRKGKRISQSHRSTESDSPTKRFLKNYMNNCNINSPVVTLHSFYKQLPVVWAKVSQNEYRLAELISTCMESTNRVTVLFFGSEKEIQIKKQDTFDCKHAIGDVILIPDNRYGVICQIFHNTKSLEIMPVEQEEELQFINAAKLITLQESHETIIFREDQIYLNNLLMKKRQGIMLFTSLSFIVTWGETGNESCVKYERKWTDFCIRNNGGTVLYLKDNQIVGLKLNPRKTVLLAEHPKRTVKFFYAICQDIPRVSIDWLAECVKIGELLPYSKFLLPNSPSPSLFPPPKLKKKLLFGQLFRLKGSHSFKVIWHTIIQSLGGSVTFKTLSIQLSQTTTQSTTTSILPSAIVIDESVRGASSTFQTLLHSITDQSNYFKQGS